MSTWTDLQGMLKDKRLLAGLGVAGALGLAVFLRRKQSGSGMGEGSVSTTGVPTSSGGFVSASPYGSVDTTGTDIAGYLSQWGESMLSAVNASPSSSTSKPSTGIANATIYEGEDVDKWLTSHGTTMSSLLALNPDLAQYVRQADNEGYHSATNPLNPSATHNVWNVAGAGGTGLANGSVSVRLPY
jgi:hypothetical protein